MTGMMSLDVIRGERVDGVREYFRNHGIKHYALMRR